MSLSTYLCSLAPFLPKDESLGSILVWPKSCNFKGLGYVQPKYTEMMHILSSPLYQDYISPSPQDIGINILKKSPPICKKNL